jgi:hypothetical protein
MKKATTVILAGIVVLFFISLFAGQKIFSAWERDLFLGGNAGPSGLSPQSEAEAREKLHFRKVRLAVSSFDLANGLTLREMEAISAHSLAFPFYFLLASLWLALGLRKPGRRPGDES